MHMHAVHLFIFLVEIKDTSLKATRDLADHDSRIPILLIPSNVAANILYFTAIMVSCHTALAKPNVPDACVPIIIAVFQNLYTFRPYPLPDV